MKGKIIILALAVMTAIGAAASDRTSRLDIGTNLLYRNGLDLTVGWERESQYHNAWEFFGNYYIQWKKCDSCGHICPQSFWKNYRTWGVGAAYKPCVARSRNRHANLRLGASIGSDTNKWLGYVHVGYESTYVLKGGWQIFWDVKTELVIRGRDHFRTGIGIGVKMPM